MEQIKKWLVAGWLAIALSGIALADNFKEGLKAYESGDFEFAYELFAHSAKEGNPLAQFNLGLMHAKGEGVTRDYERAYTWFDFAAAQEDEAPEVAIIWLGKTVIHWGIFFPTHRLLKCNRSRGNSWNNFRPCNPRRCNDVLGLFWRGKSPPTTCNLLHFINLTTPYNLAPATTLSRIESLADTILDEVGIAIEHHPPSLETLRNLGASITGERAHISGARIREFIRDKIPHTFTWQGRALAHRFPINSI